MLFSQNVKRIASILLLGILLFNMGGYRLLSNYFEDMADQRMQADLDMDLYNESDLISIKVAAGLPYGSSSEIFQKVKGNIDINGVNYSYVKRRFYQDSLELLCIPNTARASVKNARDEFARLSYDFVTNNTSKKATSHHTHSAKFSVLDFTDDHHSFSWQFRDMDLSANWCTKIFADLKSEYPGRLDRPPQA